MKGKQELPTISVVVPVYNVAPYVERCLQSVMQQTYPATECIIVDDASTDDSLARCKRLIDKYIGSTEFTFVLHDKNRGLSAARNTGVKAATSAYVYYLDSDDEITPDCLEKLVAPVQNDDSIEMVMGGFRRDYSAVLKDVKKTGEKTTLFVKGPLLELKTNEDVNEWYYTLFNTKSVSVWNKLLKLSFVKEHHLYNKEGLLWEDSLWTFYLMRNLTHAVIIRDVTYIYHIRPGSIVTGRNNERTRSFGIIHQEIAERIDPIKRKKEAQRWLHSFCHLYVDAHDNPDYQNAYTVYKQKLLDAGYRDLPCCLSVIHYLSNNMMGRVLLTMAVKGLDVARWTKMLFQKDVA